jgi:hypothetical protein
MTRSNGGTKVHDDTKQLIMVRTLLFWNGAALLTETGKSERRRHVVIDL